MITVRRRFSNVVAVGSILASGCAAAYPVQAQETAPSADANAAAPAASSDTGAVPTPEELQAQAAQLSAQLSAMAPVTLPSLARPDPVPGITSNIPTAYGAYSGQGGVGIGVQKLRFAGANSSKKYDGTAGISLGFGKPETRTGFQVGYSVLDLSNFGRRGSFDFQLHHELMDNTAVAIGIEDAFTYGDTAQVKQDERFTRNSVYAVVSHAVQLKADSTKPFGQAYFSLGLGSHRFLPERKLVTSGRGINAFGGAAVNLSRNVNAFTEWTGQDLYIGASIIPFRKVPIVITPALADVTGRAGNGSRFVLGVGYGFNY